MKPRMQLSSYPLSQIPAQEIPEQDLSLETKYQEAMKLVMDVPYIRETLPETFPSGHKFELQSEVEVPGGALNPNFSGKKLAVPLNLRQMPTAIHLARQMGFAVGKKKFLKEHNSPQQGESLELYKKRFLAELLPKVLTPGYEFEHAFITSMLRNFGYSLKDFSHEDMDCLSTVYALKFMEYIGMRDYEDEAEQRTGMAEVSLDLFQTTCTPHVEAVKKDVEQFATEVFQKGWPLPILD